MSVFTPVSEAELRTFLQTYDLGALLEYKGISAGISNTNFFVTTELGKFVLTIFEKETHEELPFFIDLMAHLSDHGIPCPHPIADAQGTYLQTIKGKPAVMVQKLSGVTLNSANVAQCHAIGAGMGSMHKAADAFEQSRENERGPSWWKQTADAVIPHLSEDEVTLLQDEIRFQLSHRNDQLPRGIIHADLFCDNTLFDDDCLSGIIDFYFACNDVLLYDLAITANDWCSNGDGTLDSERVSALLSGYNEQRPLTDVEHEDWPVMLRSAALRFWLSRLSDLHFPMEGELTHTKDPEEFRRILLDRRERSEELLNYWV